MSVTELDAKIALNWGPENRAGCALRRGEERAENALY